MDEVFLWLGRAFGRLFLLWSIWWLATVGTILVAVAVDLRDVRRVMAIAALLIFSGLYGTVMLIRAACKELDRLPADG